jgi:hydroxyacylglutathione hydrolase
MTNLPGQAADGPLEIDHQAAATKLSDQSAVFVDVREPDEWDDGHIPGALHIPLGELSERLGEVPGTTDLILVCRSGGRSAVATEFLLHNGYSRAANLAGGMLAWQEAGHPIEP